jgi:hypothetical protein
MANRKMGFEGEIYYGAAGSTASVQLLNSRDVTYGLTIEEGDTTRRGNGSSPPINTSRVTALVASIEFQMINDITDTSLTAIKAAAFAGNSVAIRTKDYASGAGFDGDMNVTVSLPYPLRGEQVVDVQCTPNDDTRTPILNA